MRSRMLFRESGHVIRTCQPWYRRVLEALATAAAVAAVIALLGWGAWHDGEAAEHAGDSPALIEARAFAQGRESGLSQGLLRAREAYSQGLRDGVDSARHTPEGVQLAQACMALRAPLRAGSP